MLYTNAKDLRSSQIPRSRFKGSSLPQYDLGGILQIGSQAGNLIGGIDAADGDLNPYAATGAGALKGAAMGAKLGSIVPGVGTAIGAGAGALIGGAAGLYKERQQQAQLDEAEAAKLKLEQQRKRALELANLQSSKAVLSTYPTQGVADAGFMMAMGGPVNDPNNPPLPSYNEKANYTPPTLRKDNRLVYGEKGTGGANVNHLNLDPRLVDAGYNLSNTLGIYDFQLNSMIKKYLDKSSKVAFYNEAQQLPFNRNARVPLAYRIGRDYQEAIEPIDNVLKKLSTLSDEDLKGLESEISKLSEPYLSLRDEESIAGKIISGGKLAVNQDWSDIKPYREKAGLSKDDIVKLIYAREDAGLGERMALSGLRSIIGMKDFAYGGSTDSPPFDMSMLTPVDTSWVKDVSYMPSRMAMGGKIPTQSAHYLAEGGEVIQHAMNDRPDTDQNGDIRQLNSNTSKFVGDSHDAASQGIGVANDQEARIYSKRLYAPKDLVAKLNKL